MKGSVLSQGLRSAIPMSALEMTRLVEVPMRVQVPPNTAAYDRGISSFLELTPARRDQAMMILQLQHISTYDHCTEDFEHVGDAAATAAGHLLRVPT